MLAPRVASWRMEEHSMTRRAPVDFFSNSSTRPRSSMIPVNIDLAGGFLTFDDECFDGELIG